METTFPIKHNVILAISVSIVLVCGLVPLGNVWSQERGLVIPEPADVAPPANATSLNTIVKDNSNASSPATIVNKSIEVPSDIPNATLESESPQSNNTVDK